MPLLPEATSDAAVSAPVLVELFTSQSCSSCPPAEALFRRIAARSDVVALEWHVDYWDELVAGASGRWKDPFSAPEHSARQRAYNVAMRGTASVYTPQIVVEGRVETVGSDRGSVERLIAAAAKETRSDVRIESARGAFTITGAPAGATATVVRFLNETATEVRAGENRSRALAEAHVVVAAQTVERVHDGATVQMPALAPGEGCALLVADGRTRKAFAAAYCPVER